MAPLGFLFSGGGGGFYVFCRVENIPACSIIIGDRIPDGKAAVMGPGCASDSLAVVSVRGPLALGAAPVKVNRSVDMGAIGANLNIERGTVFTLKAYGGLRAILTGAFCWGGHGVSLLPLWGL